MEDSESKRRVADTGSRVDGGIERLNASHRHSQAREMQKEGSISKRSTPEVGLETAVKFEEGHKRPMGRPTKMATNATAALNDEGWDEGWDNE